MFLRTCLWVVGGVRPWGRLLGTQHGSTLYTTLFSVVLLGMLSTTLATMSTSGMVGNEARFASTQSYYTALAGAEYSLMKYKNSEVPTDTSFAAGTFDLTETGEKLSVEGTRNNRSAKLTLTADSVDLGRCLIIDISLLKLNVGETDVINMTLNKDASCANITITAFKGTWTDPTGRKLTDMQIDGATVYSNPSGVVSGTEIDINPDVVLSGTAKAVNFIRYNSNMAGQNLASMFRLTNGGAGYSGSRKTMQKNNLQQ